MRNSTAAGRSPSMTAIAALWLAILAPMIAACADAGDASTAPAPGDGGRPDAEDAGGAGDGGDHPADGSTDGGAGTCMPPVAEVVLSDGDDGLELVSAPASISLELGAPASLAVTVLGHHRPLEVGAAMPIHTWVAGVTAPAPGDDSLLPVATLEAERSVLELRTVRMYDHEIALEIRPELGAPAMETTIGVAVRVPPRAVLFGTDATWLGAPFVDVYGPDCSECGAPTTEDRRCMGSIDDQSRCRPWGTRFDPEREEESVASALARQVFASQVVRDGSTDQGHVFLDQDLLAWMVGDGEYPWVADWVYGYLKPSVGGHWSGGPWILPHAAWMKYCGEACENQNGAPAGLWDPSNELLMNQFGWYVGELARRYAGNVGFYEIVNEPNAEFWLCGCSVDGAFDPSVCLDNESPAGPNLPVCWWAWDEEEERWTGGPYAQEFVEAYGDLLFETARIATEQIEEADPDAIVIAIETDVPGPGVQGLSAVARDFLHRGFFADHPSAVLGVHSYPQIDVSLWLGPIDCAYAGAFNYDLPDGCETAPPLDGTFQPRLDADPRPVRELWIAQDRATDLSELLADVRELEESGTRVRLDDLAMFDTEIHSGWHEMYGGASSALTTRAREAMAALRIGTIMAHQGFVGLEFTNAPLDPDDFNLLPVHLSGSRPVWRWGAQRIIEDETAYDGVVYKLFTRGNEDVIAVWSNGTDPADLVLDLASGDTCFSAATVTTVAATDDGALDVARTTSAAPPDTLQVESLRQFLFLSVVSDRPGFGWLADIGSAARVARPGQ